MTKYSNSSSLIDHFDRNKQNNKSSNLRPVDGSLNAHNRTKPAGKYSSDFYGVSKKGDQQYQATITKNHETKHIGTYKTEIEAAKAYDAEARKLYDSDANLNFPNEVPPPDPNTPSTSA